VYVGELRKTISVLCKKDSEKDVLETYEYDRDKVKREGYFVVTARILAGRCQWVKIEI